ncbi:MFS transporter [Stenotrophomonas maltophilia]|nr:MFS transporter [Stenotrophomonas maltophilia]MBA0369845.1 MFS transporter [Stenotrophomonas maltophilia]
MPYVGSFISQALLPLAAIPIILMLRAPRTSSAEVSAEPARSIGQLLSSPNYMLAVIAGAVSYGAMAFLMTAAPVAMVMTGHSIDNAALGIQWHLLAMFAPSFFTGKLMTYFGKERVTAVGMLVLACSAMVALTGVGLTHFWASLVLLGIGWNFSFIGATAMVSESHNAAERAKAQGMNDFFVFATTAIVSFLAGSTLHSSGWSAVNWMILPALALVLVPLLWRSATRPAAAAERHP